MTTGTCLQCGYTMVQPHVWRTWSKERRQQANREGQRQYGARGLCASHYRRAQDKGTAIDYERRTRRTVDVAEDWQDLAYARAGLSRNQAVQVLAPRMGMKPATLEKALDRAVAQGLLERQVAA